MDVPFNKADKSKIFKFEFSEYSYIVLGYPLWKAYVADVGTDFWVPVYPKINLKKQIIYFPKIKYKKAKDSNGTYLGSVKLSKKQLDMQKNFFRTIPEDFIQLASLYSNSHWTIIEGLLLFGGYFNKLIRSNASLAYLVVNLGKINPSFHLYKEIDTIKRVMLKRQKEILKIAGFPETQAMVKIFAKIDTMILTVKNIIEFRNAFITDSSSKDKLLKHLSFAPKINKQLLDFFINQKNIISILSNKVVYDLVYSEDYERQIKVIQRIHKRAVKWKIKVPEIKNIKRIDIIDKKVLVKMREKKLKKRLFPKQPLPDSEYLVAIKTFEDQVFWANQQGNCIKRLIRYVIAGKSYFYKVIYKNETATLEIKIYNDKIRMGDLLGVKNKAVSKELKKMVIKWFNDYRND